MLHVLLVNSIPHQLWDVTADINNLEPSLSSNKEAISPWQVAEGVVLSQMDVLKVPSFVLEMRLGLEHDLVEADGLSGVDADRVLKDLPSVF